MDLSKPDMTTSITDKFKAMDTISNITAFNTDPFNTWKSAFRECCKLSSKVIDRQKNQETEDRLDIWCTVGADKPYGKHAILGAKAGRGIKGALGAVGGAIKKGASAVGGAVKDTAKQLGQKITAKKLNSEWEKMGKPTDSGAIYNILSSFGMSDDNIKAVGTETNVSIEKSADD